MTQSIEHCNLNILFIGNSHTYTNKIPDMISKMAHSTGDSAFTMMSAPGGYNFRNHCVLEATQAAIKAKKWDYVVLQESGFWAAAPKSIADTMVYPYATQLNKLIKESSPSASVILYMTQGYKSRTEWCNSFSELCNYEGMQEAVKRNYLYMSGSLKAKVAPAEMIWKMIMQKNNNLELFAADGLHPNIKGSYISACTIYAVIFQKK